MSNETRDHLNITVPAPELSGLTRSIGALGTASAKVGEGHDAGVQENLVDEQVNAIMNSSMHVLVSTWDDFAKSLPDREVRYSGATRGGTAIGSRDERSLYKHDPKLLEPRVRSRLHEVVARSRDEVLISRASAKNARDVMKGRGFWTVGDLVHSTNDFSLSAILKTGLLCSELHGEGAKNDTTPLEADLSEIVETDLTFSRAVGNEQSTYSADRGGKRSVILKFRRDTDALDYGEESTGNLDESPSHRTVFVGLPSSDISGIQLAGDDVDSNELIERVINHGQYIPVYDQNDALIFTPEEFTLRTGKTIASTDIPEYGDAVASTKNQVNRMAHRLYQLASATGNQIALMAPGNSRYTHAIANDTQEDKVYMNQRGWFIENPLTKVSIPLDADRMLHVWERAGGELDMFISSLNADTQQVTERNLPEVREDLANAFNAIRSSLAQKRTAQKATLRKGVSRRFG